MNVKVVMQRCLAWLANWQVFPVGLLIPILIFPDRFPDWIVSLALLVIPILWFLFKLTRGAFFCRTPVDIPLLVLLATLPVGWWAAALPELAVPHLIKYLIAIALFYALVNTLDDERKVALAGRTFLLGTALIAFASLLGMAWSGGSKFLPIKVGDYLPRVINAFWNPNGFHPNIVGGILTMFVPVTLAYAWYARQWPLRLSLFLLFFVEAATLVFTQSRGALLGFAVALPIVAICRHRRWVWIVPIMLLAAGIGISIHGVQPTFDLVMGSVGESAVRSGEGRIELFSRGFYMLQDFPFTGIGLGMFPRVLPLLYPLFLVGPDTVMPHVHNIFLQVGIDHGFPGLIAFLAMIVLMLVMGVQAIRLGRGTRYEPLAIGLFAGLAAYLVHGMADAVGYTPRASILIWGFLGLLAGVWRWAQESQLSSQGQKRGTGR